MGLRANTIRTFRNPTEQSGQPKHMRIHRERLSTETKRQYTRGRFRTDTVKRDECLHRPIVRHARRCEVLEVISPVFLLHRHERFLDDLCLAIRETAGPNRVCYPLSLRLGHLFEAGFTLAKDAVQRPFGGGAVGRRRVLGEDRSDEGVDDVWRVSARRGRI